MMSVQRTDSEGEDSFEEMGDPYEDFASSEKLVEQADRDYKVFLEAQREAVLGKIDKFKTMVEESEGWFDETGALSVENQLKGAMRELENRLLEIDTELGKMTKSQKQVLGEP